MSVLMIETDTLTSASSQISSQKSKLDSAASNVGGYDTSAEEFDFSSAAKALASSIEACATKMQNTSNFLESVVTSHTSFQNSVKFESSEEKAAREAEEKKNTTGSTGSTSGSTGGSSYSGGGSSGGGSYGGGGSHHSSSPNSTKNKKKKKDKEKDKKAKEDEIIKEKEITEKIDKVDYNTFKDTTLTDASKKILENSKYNENGYALYNGMYVISCATSVGVIGDVIEFKLKDGNTIKCVVGMNNNTQGNITFAVNDKFDEKNESNITNNLINNIDKITNKAPGQPVLGIYTKEYETQKEKWTITETKTNIDEYLKTIEGKISQNVDKEKYKNKDLSFAETHAYALYSGKTDDTIDKASTYQHSGQFTTFKTDSKESVLNKIYTEIANGRPVIVQANGNKAGTSSHFITVVGFKNTVTDPSKITEKDLLIIDPYEGKVERMDQTNSRFLTTGKNTHKSYDGYYLRVLKSDNTSNNIINQATVNNENTTTTEQNANNNTTLQTTETSPPVEQTEDNTTQTTNQQNITETEENVNQNESEIV